MVWLNRLPGVSGRSFFRTSRSAGSLFHRGPAAVAVLAATLGALALGVTGCGNQYRPVVNPIQPTGPSSVPTGYVTVVSQPGFSPITEDTTSPCIGTTYANPSVLTLLDFSGDSIVAQANGGNGPMTFSMETGGANIYAPNCDGTLSTAQATTTALLTQDVQNSTMLSGSEPTNTLFANDSLYVTQIGLHGSSCVTTAAADTGDCVAQMTGSPPGLKQEIPVAPSLINLTGYSTGQRIYAISQGNSTTAASSQPAWGACANPSSVAVDGEADAIETASNTISARLPLGICPVFGFMTPDTERVFIMNRGSGTVTVINSQLNALDTTNPNLGPNATIKVGAGPVYADYYRNGQLLVTANYDSDTISIIDVSLDDLGNDSATFGKVLATVPVGLHPVEVAVLQDGSRVYVANQGDIAKGISGSVSIVNLTDYTVEKTIPLSSNPHAIGAIYNYPEGKVYVASQNSPYLTIIRTDTDVIGANPEMQGNIVDMHVNSQYPGQSTAGSLNYQTESRSVGSGAP
jgi:DNA-binding beta-propeller fold protein YncE